MSFLMKKSQIPWDSPHRGNTNFSDIVELRKIVTPGLTEDELPGEWDDDGESWYPIYDYHTDAFTDSDYDNYVTRPWLLAVKQSEIPWAHYLTDYYVPGPVYKADGSLDYTNSRFLVLRGTAVGVEGGFINTQVCVNIDPDNPNYEIHGTPQIIGKETLSGSIGYNADTRTLSLSKNGSMMGYSSETVTECSYQLYFELCGAGGGGGGAISTSGTTAAAAAGGGGGGCICGIIDLDRGSYTLTYNLGVGGKPGNLGATGPWNGTAGTGSSLVAYDSDGEWAASISAPGGQPGTGTSSGGAATTVAGTGGTNFTYSVAGGSMGDSSGTITPGNWYGPFYILAVIPGGNGGKPSTIGGYVSATVEFTNWYNHNISKGGGSSTADTFTSGIKSGGGGGASAISRGANGRGSTALKSAREIDLACHATKGAGGGGCGSLYAAANSGGSSIIGGYGGNGCLLIYPTGLYD